MSDPKMIHALEQMTAGLVDMAKALGRYHQALRMEGFTREEALGLCIAWQRALLAPRTDGRDVTP